MTELVRQVVAIEAVALVVLVAAALATAALRSATAALQRPQQEAAGAALGDAIVGRRSAADALEAMRRLTHSGRMRVIVELARDLRDRAILAQVAGELGIAARAERATRGRAWWRRLHAVRLLGAIGRGTNEVPPLLADPDPFVRAEAAWWAGETGRGDLAPALIALVEAPALLPRAAAQDALIRLGSGAHAALAERVRRSGLVGRPLMRVIAASPPPVAAGRLAAMAASPASPVRDLAIDALAALGTEDAPRAAIDALGDERSTVRASAAAALGRLRDARSAAALARAASDPSWDVRRAAALSLRDLGGAGTLYLRGLATGSDRFAADMARHVMATAETR